MLRYKVKRYCGMGFFYFLSLCFCRGAGSGRSGEVEQEQRVKKVDSGRRAARWHSHSWLWRCRSQL